MKDNIERIEKMETILDESVEVIKYFTELLEKFSEVQKKINIINDYYGSDDWHSDLDLDEKGKLPENLKRGVLSEDTIYDLLTDNHGLAIRMLEIATKVLKKE